MDVFAKFYGLEYFASAQEAERGNDFNGPLYLKRIQVSIFICTEHRVEIHQAATNSLTSRVFHGKSDKQKLRVSTLVNLNPGFYFVVRHSFFRIYLIIIKQIKVILLVSGESMDDSSNGRAVALYPADPGSNPRFGSV